MKKRSNLIKVLAIVFCIQLSFLLFASISYAEFNNMPIAIYNEEELRIDLNSSMVASKRLMSSPNYDIRNDIFLNAQRRKQGTTNTCWTFSSLAVLESNLALQEALNGATKNNINYYDFSEMHMDYATSSLSGTNNWGYSKEVNEGGNPLMAFSYFTRGSGPVLESDMPFMESQPPISINTINSKEAVKKIEDYSYFPSISKVKTNGQIIYKNGDTIISEEQALKNRNKIKEHIIKYGAVTAATKNPNERFIL